MQGLDPDGKNSLRFNSHSPWATLSSILLSVPNSPYGTHAQRHIQVLFTFASV